MRGSRALKTTPMAPRPSSRIISYLPSLFSLMLLRICPSVARLAAPTRRRGLNCERAYGLGTRPGAPERRDIQASQATVAKIGRASCRERVESAAGAGALKKKEDSQSTRAHAARV